MAGTERHLIDAVIHPESARFVIPSGRTVDQWEWGGLPVEQARPTCSGHVCNFGGPLVFSWVVKVPEVEPGFEFGAMFFPPRDSVLHVEKLQDVLRRSYVRLWNYRSSGGTADARYLSGFPHHEVTAVSDAGRVVITLRGRDVVARLFGHKPATVMVVRQIPFPHRDTLHATPRYAH
jgi:hypothetical protein